MEKWNSLPYADRYKLPKHCVAVYAVLTNEVVLYIGSTWDVLNRICQHRIDFAAYNATTVKWLPVEESELAIEEVRAIGYYRPLLNKGRIMTRKPKLLPNEKRKLETPELFIRTLELLKNRPPELTFPMIERDTGLSVAWLTFLSSKGVEFDPSLKRIVVLYEYLSHTKLVAP